MGCLSVCTWHILVPHTTTAGIQSTFKINAATCTPGRMWPVCATTQPPRLQWLWGGPYAQRQVGQVVYDQSVMLYMDCVQFTVQLDDTRTLRPTGWLNTATFSGDPSSPWRWCIGDVGGRMINQTTWWRPGPPPPRRTSQPSPKVMYFNVN